MMWRMGAGERGGSRAREPADAGGRGAGSPPPPVLTSPSPAARPTPSGAGMRSRLVQFRIPPPAGAGEACGPGRGEWVGEPAEVPAGGMGDHCMRGSDEAGIGLGLKSTEKQSGVSQVTGVDRPGETCMMALPLNYLEAMPMFEFKHLDERTRELMIREAEADGMAATEYYGRRLSAKGREDWPVLLRSAIASGDAETLAAKLRHDGRLKTEEERRTKTGVKMVAVPVNAADVLAQGEFNRYYIRALCLRVIEDGGTHVVVCRGRWSDNPRPESEALIGKEIPAQSLLEDVRAHPGEATFFGVPIVNSGLTVRLS